MIYMNLRVVPAPKRIQGLIQALRLHMGRTEVQPGCLKCVISQDCQDPGVVLYQEQWKSWLEMEKHIRSERFVWILELMEQSSDTPILTFSDVQETRGMDYVKKLRTESNP